MAVLWGMMEQIDRQRRSKMIDEAVDATTLNPMFRYTNTETLDETIRSRRLAQHEQNGIHMRSVADPGFFRRLFISELKQFWLSRGALALPLGSATETGFVTRMTNHYAPSQYTKQYFALLEWRKTVVNFMVQSDVNEFSENILFLRDAECAALIVQW